MAGQFTHIPAIVKHTTLAIYKKKGSLGADAFEYALKTALSHLKYSGYLTAASLKPLYVRLTGKGVSRNRTHLREGLRKGLQFDALFENYQLRTAAAGKPLPDSETEKLPSGQRE